MHTHTHTHTHTNTHTHPRKTHTHTHKHTHTHIHVLHLEKAVVAADERLAAVHLVPERREVAQLVQVPPYPSIYTSRVFIYIYIFIF